MSTFDDAMKRQQAKDQQDESRWAKDEDDRLRRASAAATELEKTLKDIACYQQKSHRIGSLASLPRLGTYLSTTQARRLDEFDRLAICKH